METVRFDELNLDERILRAVTDMGFEAASPIQAQSIPVQAEGLDMIGQAQTGTGKTAAFGIPLLEKMDPESRKTQAMVLCPTRAVSYTHLDVYKRQDVYRTLFFYCHEGRMEVLVSGPEPVILDEGQGLLLRGLPSGSRIAYEIKPGTRAVKAEIHEKHENDKN